MTAGTDFNRSNISAYERAVTLPRTEHLHALAKTLGVNPADLIPARGVASVNTKASPVSMQDLGDGRVWLRVNSTVPWETALEIIRKVKESDEPTDK
ncbi:hypothetical protein AL346_20480 [Chelatococcus sp. CO-6]|nr:hypothetical protein AL346_00020 [Chelatococcus sp. CO-6]ALA19357.1 hypothetical protein AL346_20480 [Chelatococcus sp. CO-6]